PSDTAWHAGDGERWTIGGPLPFAGMIGTRPAPHRFGSRVSINTASIGVALCKWGPRKGGEPGAYTRPGFGRWTHFEPFPAVQLAALDALVDALAAAHPTLRFVCGHQDVTYQKGDPGPLLAGWRPSPGSGLTRIMNHWDAGQ